MLANFSDDLPQPKVVKADIIKNGLHKQFA